jgi:hypothetical protein
VLERLAISDPPATAINDCWNRIGVRGDASCPELAEHAHCRNCPVFATAALALLDRELPAGYAAEWMGYIAAKRGGTKSTERQSGLGQSKHVPCRPMWHEKPRSSRRLAS